MSAPRKIWTDHGSDDWAFGSANAYDEAAPGLHLYHHDDVVRELVEALERARAFIHGPGDRCGPVLRHIDAALAKIAQEDRG